MSYILYWSASKIVYKHIEHIRQKINLSSRYGIALMEINKRYKKESDEWSEDFYRLNQSTRIMHSRFVVESIIEICGYTNIVVLQNHIIDAAKILAKHSNNDYSAYLEHLRNSENVLTERQRRQFEISDADKKEILTLSWRSEIEKLLAVSEKEEWEDHSYFSYLSRPYVLRHITSIDCAHAIISDCFRVSRHGNNKVIDSDQCANFYSGSRLSSEAKNTGCKLHFSWSGTVVDGNRMPVSSMEKNILYIQTVWRSVLRPDTSGYLRFLSVEFDSKIEEPQFGKVSFLLNSRGKDITIKWG